MSTLSLTTAQAMRLARRFKGACEREDSDLDVRVWVADAAADMMLYAGGQPPAWLKSAAGAATVKGRNVKPGQVIKSAGRWYTVTRLYETEGSRFITALVTDTKGRALQLGISVDDDYPVREA